MLVDIGHEARDLLEDLESIQHEAGPWVLVPLSLKNIGSPAEVCYRVLDILAILIVQL